MANPILKHPRFHDEQSAYDWVEAIVWEGGRVCPHCGVVDSSGALKGKTNRIGLYKCYACRKPFTVKIGTIFEDSHAPLHLWMQAMYLLCSSKKGISTNQLRRTLGVHMKTAWHMSHRIRLAMGDPDAGPLGGEGKTVEADETYIVKQRGRATWELVNDKGWVKRADRRELIVFALVERGGKVRAERIENVTSDTLQAALERNASTDSALMTDDWSAYQRPGRKFASHETVTHSEEEYARYEKGRMITTNTVEGFFSVFKRGLRGVYQHCSEDHLQRYLDEFSFRYSNRMALGVDDEERTDRAIRGIIGKRLTYRETVDAKKTKAP